MTKIEQLLDEYGASHQNPINKIIHWICVPSIIISLMGLIWSLPVPAFMENVQLGPMSLNWVVLFIVASLIYYFSLSFSLAIGMIFLITILISAGYLLSTYIPLPLWVTSLILFTLAWIGQFWGHKVEGKKPSFLKDIQFLLIGPVWLLSFIYIKLGIPYSGTTSNR